MTWQDVSISMKPLNCAAKELFIIKENLLVRKVTKKIKQILVAEYKKINLKSIIMSLNYLKEKYYNSLLRLFQKYEKIFDGTLGKKYTGSDYTIELKEDAKPYHVKLFPIQNIHEPTFKKEVNRSTKEN